MNENLELEAFQRKSFNQIAAKYEFTASYDGAESKTSPKLNALVPGIRLHFLRYGLFKTDSPDDVAFHIYGQNNKKKDSYSVDEVKVDNSKIPENKNFYTARTSLNKGYVYLFRDGDPNEHYELEISESGTISHVLWEYSKKDGKYLDIRESQNDSVDYKIITGLDKTFWIAYTPVQWNIEHHYNLLTDENLRKEYGMVKVKCNGFNIGKSYEVSSRTDSVVHYEALKFVHYKEHPRINSLKALVKQIDSQERKEDRKGDNEIFEDMFITLNDPVGCAYDICVGIHTEINRLKAIMVSLQSAKPVEEIFTNIQNNNQISIDTSDNSKQIQYLHRLAQLTYDFVYNDREKTEKYNSDLIENTAANIALDLTVGSLLRPFIEKNGVKKTKLEKILGVKERADQRAVINSYRNDLGNLKKSDYYENATDDFMNSIPDSIETAKGIIADHIIWLSKYPNMFDRHLDLEIVYKPEQDEWYEYIKKSMYSEDMSDSSKSDKLLNYKIDLQDIFTLDLSKKTVSNIGKIVEAYAGHSDFKGGYATLALHNKISYFKDKKSGVISFKFTALKDFDKYLAENKKQIRYVLGKQKISLHQFKQNWHLEYKKMAVASAQQFIDEGKVVINLKNVPKRFESQFKNFYQSGTLAGVLLVIEAFVLAEAFQKYRKEGGRDNAYILAGASIKLGAAITRIATQSKIHEKLLMEKSAEKFSIFSKSLSIASSAISVYSLAKSSLTSHSYRDADAALAYGIATGLSGIFLAADISTFYAACGGVAFLSIGFWPAALLGGAIVVSIYLINKYLKDTELEAYFKNFPISDYTLNPDQNELPDKYILRLLNNISSAITGEIYQDFKDLEIAFIELSDMLTPSHTQVEVLLEKDQLKAASNKKYHTSLHYTDTYDIYINRFKVHLFSAYGCSGIEDLDIQAWFYPNGIQDNAKKIEITTFIYDFPKHGNRSPKNEQLPSCIIDFAVPQHYRYEYISSRIGYEYRYAEVLFLIRIINDKDKCEYSPEQLKNEDRYKHVYLSVKQTFIGQNSNLYKILGPPESHYTGQKTNKNVKPKQLTLEQAIRKRDIFSVNQLENLQTYIPKNE
ncbi:toxin VasX [Cellulophaga baltica]|uniref:toxin VasX n=1 Tax=Cellulophaga baltica TaxID=76594 RepID=UPI0004274DF5|nr:toxin VasX [Cellulophaga baltica]